MKVHSCAKITNFEILKTFCPRFQWRNLKFGFIFVNNADKILHRIHMYIANMCGHFNPYDNAVMTTGENEQTIVHHLSIKYTLLSIFVWFSEKNVSKLHNNNTMLIKIVTCRIDTACFPNATIFCNFNQSRLQ